MTTTVPNLTRDDVPELAHKLAFGRRGQRHFAVADPAWDHEDARQELALDALQRELGRRIDHAAERMRTRLRHGKVRTMRRRGQRMTHRVHAMRDMAHEPELAVDDRPERDLRRVEARLDAADLLRRVPNRREREVLYRRFFQQQTLAEVGRSMNYTGERVRQMQHSALRRLRNLIQQGG